MGNCRPPGGQIHNYVDDIAIVNYPCYYCNGFQPRDRERRTGRDLRAGINPLCQDLFEGHGLMLCRVESYSGFRGHERPRRFTWGEAWLEIEQIMAQWVTPSSSHFKVRVKDRVYHLEYRQAEDVWEVELVRSPWGLG